MITLDVKTDIAKALKQFAVLEPRQFPFIVALAMNRTMKRIKENEGAEMLKVYDRPTPFTLNSLRTVAATKAKLEASIALRDFAGKGTPASKYLPPTIQGGGRAYKSHEKALAAAGLLPAGMYAVPAQGVALNRYGNLPGPYINRILSYVRANSDATQNRGRGRGSRKNAAGRRYGVQYWVRKVSTADGLPLGIYERKGGTNRLVIAFVKAPRYRKQFRFYDLAQRDAQAYLAVELRKAAEHAIRTSRDPRFELEQLVRLLNGAGFRT